MTPTEERAFAGGILCTLAIVSMHDPGDSTIMREIVTASGEEWLIAEARKRGEMRRSGLDRYWRERKANQRC